MKYYAGIGSRETPHDVLRLMSKIARKLALENWTLRSGGARGADSAFHKGSLDVAGNAEIFTAQHATPESLKLAEKYHPNWSACDNYTRRLHARNGLILLGENLDSPVKFIICWTLDGKVAGGTGQALRIATDYGIKVRNLGIYECYQEALKYV